MAITRRVTNTITEEFAGSDLTTLGAESTQGGGTPIPTLSTIKSDVTPLDAEDSEKESVAIKSGSPTASDFSDGLRAWITHHVIKVILASVAIVASVGAAAFFAGERLAKSETRLEGLDREFREFKTDLKAAADRILKLEFTRDREGTGSGNR